MNSAPLIDAMQDAARVLTSGDVRAKLHALQAVTDAADCARGLLLAELEASKEFELDGASTLNTWVRNQLRMNAGQANALGRGVRAMRDLPMVAEAAQAGLISAAHLRVFVYGIKHLGLELMLLHQQTYVQLAIEQEPAALLEGIKYLQDRHYPEDLDDKYEHGMDRQDIAVDALLDGFHVTGFLNTVTGLKFKKVLDSVSAPRDKDDQRSGAERRVQGLDDLLTAILAGGLPSDTGVKPHMSVFVDADTLQAAAEHVQQATEDPFGQADPMPETEPATLAGHGHIGPNLLMYFLCISDFTAFLMKSGGRQAQILNAGRGKYQPTMLQRRGVIARQKGVCATPGCNHTHLEVHHVIWWSLGGRTDIDQLIGLCTRCHHLVHRHQLKISGNAADGFTFTTQTNRPLRRKRRTHTRQAA